MNFTHSVIAVFCLVTCAMPAAALAAPPVTLSLERHPRMNVPSNVPDTIVETIAVQAKSRVDVRALTIVIEGRNRRALPLGNETVGSIIARVDLRNPVTGRIMEFLPTTSAGGMQRYVLNDFILADKEHYSVRMTVKGNKKIDQLRVLICGSASAVSCGEGSGPKVEDLNSGNPVSLNPAAGLIGSWVTFRPAKRK